MNLDTLRNIGIIAHIDAGKTTLTERMLFYSKKIHRLGEVHEGTATMDYMPEEQERGITIASACTTCLWRDHVINIIDTPGHVDFTIEVERALRVLDGAVGVFSAVDGVEPQSETVWRQSERYRVPKVAFVNKMDRDGADFAMVLDDMVAKLKARPLPLVVPDGGGDEFSCLYDLVAMRRLVFDKDSFGATFERHELSEEDRGVVGPWRERMLEALAEADEEFFEAYLAASSQDDLDPDLVRAAVRRATLARAVTPVLAGSALRNVGAQLVLDAVCDYLPSPPEAPRVQALDARRNTVKLDPSPKDPLAGLVFKVIMESGRKLVLMRLYAGSLDAGMQVYNVTQDKKERAAQLFHLHAHRREKLERALAGDIVAVSGLKFAKTGDTLCDPARPVLLESINAYKPVISLAIEPQNTEEQEKLSQILDHYLLEDPTLSLVQDEDTGQFILSGMGELHLEVVLERLAREAGLTPRAGRPQVVYQETVTQPAEAVEEFERTLGETMHHGRVGVSVAPLPRDTGRDVQIEANTEAIPRALVDAAAEGVEDGLQSGVVRGYPVQDVRVHITQLVRKEGVSTPAGFRMAAASALKKALAAGSPRLLEPIMHLEVTAPEEFVGDVVGLLGAKGAKIENMLDRGGIKVVQALTPLASLFGFSTDLRSATQGRAGMTMTFARFDLLG